MKLLPYDSFEIQTSLSLEETLTRLNAQVGPRTLFRTPADKRFQGKTGPNGFRIFRSINYRNSFLPIIYGRFQQGATGITVTLRMKLHPGVMLFLLVWFGGACLGVIFVSGMLINGNTKFQPPLLIPYLLLFGGWALVNFGFWYEAEKAKKILLEIFPPAQTGMNVGAH